MSTVSRLLGCGNRRSGFHTLLWVTFLVTLDAAVHLLPMLGGYEVEAGGLVAPASARPETQRLVGRWVRPDGGYILDLRDVAQDGSLKAAYFNPRPINVARAEWRHKGDALTVFVELRDVNYPGSTYTLQYDPALDRLKGTYYQAVEKKNFAIEFVRGK